MRQKTVRQKTEDKIMTEDQKAMSLILDLLNATRVPRALQWIEDECRMAGRKCEVPTILETLADKGFVETGKDGLGVRRWSITQEGRKALMEL